MDRKITPVLLGGDLNAYSMALAFFDAIGCISHVFSRERLALTDTSSFIITHKVKELDNPNIAVPCLLDFADEHSNEILMLIPCADWYVEMLEYASDVLSEKYFFFIPDFEVWRAVSDKASFAAIMSKYSVNYPKTEIFDSRMQNFEKKCRNLKPPFVVKPADSSEYWRHAFENMKKVYFAHSIGEAMMIARAIFFSGYSGKLLVQEYVGDEKAPQSSVLTVFCDSGGRAVAAVLADILLEEISPTARGNYSAVITRPLNDISHRLISMLESIGYTGIANFDIVTQDGKDYCLELNPRQGRCSDYILAANINLAEFFISVMKGEKYSDRFVYPEILWRCVSKRTMRRYAPEIPLAMKADALEKSGRSYTPYKGRGDMGIRRRAYVMAHLYRQGKCYKKFSSGKQSPSGVNA